VRLSLQTSALAASSSKNLPPPAFLHGRLLVIQVLFSLSSSWSLYLQPHSAFSAFVHLYSQSDTLPPSGSFSCWLVYGLPPPTGRNSPVTLEELCDCLSDEHTNEDPGRLGQCLGQAISKWWSYDLDP
jgi:hypothetical protein